MRSIFLLDDEPSCGAEAVRLELTSGRAPPVFKTGSSSGRMTSVLSCGSWNRTNGLLVQSQASLPTATIPHDVASRTRCPCTLCIDQLGEQESNLRTPGSKPGGLPASRSRIGRVPCGSRTRLARLEAWSLCRSAKGTCCRAEGEGVEPSRLLTLDRVRGGCHRQLACPSVVHKAAEAGIEPAYLGAVNSRPPVPAQDPPHHVSQDGWI